MKAEDQTITRQVGNVEVYRYGDRIHAFARPEHLAEFGVKYLADVHAALGLLLEHENEVDMSAHSIVESHCSLRKFVRGEIERLDAIDERLMNENRRLRSILEKWDGVCVCTGRSESLNRVRRARVREGALGRELMSFGAQRRVFALILDRLPALPDSAQADR